MDKMTPQQASNLFLLARHMEGLTRTLYMQAYENSLCGTPACALGEAGCLDKIKEQGLVFNGDRLCFHGRGMLGNMQNGVTEKLFGLSPDENFALFGIESVNVWKQCHVSGKAWAKEALRVLAEHGYSSDPAMAQDRPMFCGAGTDNDCRYPACSCAENLEDVRAFCARMAEVELREEAETY